MKVLVNIPGEIEIKVGDEVYIGRKDINFVKRTVKVRRLVETKSCIYAVLSNHTWRPVTTYNNTWWKV